MGWFSRLKASMKKLFMNRLDKYIQLIFNMIYKLYSKTKWIVN